MSFLYSDNNKRYHTLSYHFAHNGGKQVKACLDGGFSCPNRKTGGCTYCINGGGYFTAPLPLHEQIDREVARLGTKDKIIGYLQAGSNTFAEKDTLRKIYSEVVSHPAISGLTVATRADCISPEVVAVLKEFSARVELGLQTVHDQTAREINRGHDFKTFQTGYSLLKEAGLRVCVHLIDGLPFETAEMMVESAKVLGQMKPDGVKIHALHLLRGTKMAEDYEKGLFSLLSLEEYADIVVRQLEVLPPETVIERLTGDGEKSLLLAPLWTADKKKVLAKIDNLLAERDTWQGRLFSCER